MTERTPEFKACFHANYGSSYIPCGPDYARCCQSVMEGFHSSQCARKNGHGPHGAYCKQHDPIARKAKDDARSAKWRGEWAAKARASEFFAACQQAIRDIAAGHNDPRGLAQSIIDKLENRG